MKKIFAVSIMAVMAVTAANAEIASKAYVDQQRDAAVSTSEGYTDERLGNIAEGTTVAQAIANAVQTGVTTGVAWNNISDTPTTLSGYGITDAYTSTETDAAITAATTTAGMLTTGNYSTTLDPVYINTTDVATSSVAGVVKGGGNVAIANDGTLSVADATNAASGVIRIATDAEATAGQLTTVAVTPAQLATASDTTALAGRVSANETAISTINSSAPMTSGITSTLVGKITTNESAITTLNGDDQTVGSVDYKIAAAESTLQTAIDAKAATADLGSLAYKSTVASADITDGAVQTADIGNNQVTLGKLSASLPLDCQASGAECVLKSSSGALAWEVIQRATSGDNQGQ